MGRISLDPAKRYDMPATFGPSVAPDVEEGFDLHGSEVSFESDASAVDELLPRWFRSTERPLVSVAYRHMIGMRWMGGRDYRLVTVRVTAHCDAVEGAPVNQYSWVIWESDCAPVLAGRELMGSPKLYGTIPAIRVGGDDHEFTCSEYDAMLIRARLTQMAPVSSADLALARERGRTARSYYWKYVPGPQGTVDADYPVGIRMDIPYTQMWRGNGELDLLTPPPHDAPYSSKILAALAELPRRSEPTALSWRASECTLFRGETRRLDRPGASEWLASAPRGGA